MKDTKQVLFWRPKIQELTVNLTVIWNFQQGACEMMHMLDVRKRSAISLPKMLSATVQFAVARVICLVHPCYDFSKQNSGRPAYSRSQWNNKKITLSLSKHHHVMYMLYGNKALRILDFDSIRIFFMNGTWSLLEIKRPGIGFDHPAHLAPRLKKE
jgi:hypothetical protein